MSLRTFLKSKATCVEVANEVYEQIIICEDLCRPLSFAKIDELCKCKSAIAVQNALHDWKFK